MRILKLTHRMRKNVRSIVGIYLLLCAIYSQTLIASQSNYVGKLDTLTTFSKKHGGFYYRDKNILAYASRFNLDRNCELVGVNLVVSGDTGTCKLRVYGYEGGANAPVIEEDICKPVYIRKLKSGIEKIYVEFQQRPKITWKQFFLCIDSMSNNIHLLTDTVRKNNWCTTTSGEKYYYQMLKLGVNNEYKWNYSKFSFMIEPIVVYEPKVKPAFSLDSLILEFDNSLNAQYKGNNHSISCADINNDGYVDIMNNGRLFQNENGNRFREVTKYFDIHGQPSANIFLDINNDGFQDILFIGALDSVSKPMLYVNSSGGGVVQLKSQLPEFNKVNCFALADINQDGFTDLVIGGKGEKPLYVLVNNKFNDFDDKTTEYLPNTIVLNECSSITFSDVDNDGLSDLYVNGYSASKGRSIKFILMNKGNMFSYIEFPSKNNDGSKDGDEKIDFGASWCDIDNDGIMDLCTSERILRKNYSNNGKSLRSIYYRKQMPDITFVPPFNSPFNYSEKITSSAWSDIDNDGMIDCLLSTDCSCRNANVYLQRKPSAFFEVSNELGLGNLYDLLDALWLDFNHDGRQDLFCVIEDKLSCFSNQTDSYHNFIQINLHKELEKLPLGAMVKVYTDSAVFVKEITSGRGLKIQDSPILHFGLGDVQNIDSILVQFQGKEYKYSSDIKINQIQNIILDRGFISNNNALTLSLNPNPFTFGLKISFQLQKPSEIGISIYNINGRKVKQVLTNSSYSGGSYLVEWDGKDEVGEVVPAGIYLVRISGTNVESVSQVTKID